jgi:hypothetical protein
MSVHVDFTKLTVAVALIAAAVCLSIFGDLSSDTAWGGCVLVCGYILGNGRSVAGGYRPGTLLTRTDVRTRAIDQETNP